MNKSCRSYWDLFLSETNRDKGLEPIEVFYFSDSKEYADELAEATIAGVKTGTCSLLLEFEENGMDIPKPGDLSIVTWANGEPACIIETKKVNLIPFNEVDADFAATEGERDPSLNHWRECHWREFDEFCRKIGKEPKKDMLVICEIIEMIYK